MQNLTKIKLRCSLFGEALLAFRHLRKERRVFSLKKFAPLAALTASIIIIISGGGWRGSSGASRVTMTRAALGQII